MKLVNYNSDQATSIEACRSVEMCRKHIIDNQSSDSFRNDLRCVISSLEEAIVGYAIILGKDNPAEINAILDEIGYTGPRNFDEEI